MLIPVPYAIAATLGPRERLKTAAFLEEECRLATSSAYRLTEETINRHFHRDIHNPDDMIHLGTLYDDVIRSNCMEAKKEEAFKILEEYGFDSSTGMRRGGIDSLPETMRNGKMDTVQIEPSLLEANASPITFDNVQDIPMPDEYELDGTECPLENNGETQTQPAQYSQPDTREIEIKPKLRKKRDLVSPEEMETVLDGFQRWWNQRNEIEGCRILHSWTVEKDSSQVVYIYIDGDCVFKQAEKRIRGGCSTIRTVIDRRNQYNAVICAEGYKPYYVTYPEDVDVVCKMILAVLLQNHLLNRNLVFFLDGEKVLYTAVEKYFSMWNPAIYLDWYHLCLKVYTCLSKGLRPQREDDPRSPIEYYKRGKNAGQPKPRKKTSLSILFARMLYSMLWVGNVEEAKDYIRNIDPSLIQNKEAIDELLTYLENKGKYITCYALRKRAGLRNSSNIVESANRRMVSGRQKHRGMLWSDAGSDAITSLTVLFMNCEETLWFYHHEVTFAMEQSVKPQQKLVA